MEREDQPIQRQRLHHTAIPENIGNVTLPIQIERRTLVRCKDIPNLGTKQPVAQWLRTSSHDIENGTFCRIRKAYSLQSRLRLVKLCICHDCKDVVAFRCRRGSVNYRAKTFGDNGEPALPPQIFLSDEISLLQLDFQVNDELILGASIPSFPKATCSTSSRLSQHFFKPASAFFTFSVLEKNNGYLNQNQSQEPHRRIRRR